MTADVTAGIVCGDVNEAAERLRIDGVVGRVEADVVVPAKTDPFLPAQLQRDRTDCCSALRLC